jgi:S1-C subfamily serine protease
MGTKFTGLLLVAAVAAGLAACGGSEAAKTNRTTQPKTLTQRQVIDRSSPAVVEITAKLADGDVGGTGVVIDAGSGYVLTNAHVVQGATSLQAQVLDETTVPASLVASSPCDDLALIKLNAVPAGVKAMPIGESAKLRAGDTVTALGYPETLDQSGQDTKVIATTGTVSQPNTSAAISDDSPFFPALIQHQAAINHGNSGGPLINAKAELVGINTLTGAGGGATGQIQGQFYSIAIDHVQSLLPQLESGEDIANVGWNVTPISHDVLQTYFEPELAEAVANYLIDNEEAAGLFVLGSDPASPAAEGQFVEGDYITAINGRPVTSVADVCEIAQSNPGRTVQVEGLWLASAEAAGKEIGDRFTGELALP